MATYIDFQPSDFFTPKLYTGTGAEQAITGVGFQPDIVWCKNRTETYDHVLCNSVTGTGKRIDVNQPAGVVTDVQSVKSFDADGYTWGTSDEVNKSSIPYGNWNWKMGTTTGIAGSPSITPTSYSFNATAGQSIITYTGNSTAGATLPHGLGVAPKMIIVKKTDASDSWGVYHNSMDVTAPEDYYMFLDSNAARVNSTMWNDTAPTSTLFYLGGGGDVNDSSNTYLAMCFADVKGYSKFGTYQSNGSATDGPFIFTGFRPAFTMIKMTNGTNGWVMNDNKRSAYNGQNNTLWADATTIQSTAYDIPFFSNGFKIYTNDSYYNGSATNTFVYMAFAEFPLVSSNSLPGVAR